MTTTDRTRTASPGPATTADPIPVARLSADELAVVEPAPAKRWLGVMNSPPWRGHGVELIVTVLAGTIALGTWGFSRLPLKPPESLGQDLYHALRLYALDLGPAGGGYSQALHAKHGLVPSAGPNWQIVVAFVLAIVLVARAVIALVAGTMRRYVTRHLFSGHVIVCGAGVHGTALAQQHHQAHNVVLIDLDSEAPGMKSPSHRNEWRLVADAVQRRTLETAGVGRASRVIAVTGNDFVNSQIVTAILGLAEDDARSSVRPRRKTSLDSLQVLVQVEHPSLARFLEEEEEREQDQLTGASTSDRGRRHRKHDSGPTTSVFAANAVAAGALFGEGSIDRRHAPDPNTTAGSNLATDQSSDRVPLAATEEAPAPHLLLAGDHPLLEAIALAALRRRRARWQREAAANGGADLPALRVSLLGPGASSRVEWLTERWLPEADVLELEGEDVALGDIQGLPIDWLRTRSLPNHAIVACNEELDGIGLALVVSRALGPAAEVKVTRVAAQPASELDHHLSRHTKRSPNLATTQVRSIDELAWQHNPVEHVSTSQRLLRCLVAEGVERPSARHQVEALLDGLAVHADPAPRVTPGSEPLLRAMLRAVVPPEQESLTLTAMIAAGVAPDLDSPSNLLLAARELDRLADPDSLSAWCEFIRRVGAASPDSDPSRTLLKAVSGTGMQVKVLRDAAIATGTRNKPARVLEELPGDRLTALQDAQQIVIFAGSGGHVSLETCRALETMLEERALLCFDGLLLVSEGANGLAAAVQRAAERAGTADDLPASVRAAARGKRSRVLQWPAESGAVRMWAEILAARVPVGNVYVIGVPGAEKRPDELVLARALGAQIAWLDPADEMLRPLDDLLPLGADEVLELPADGMTLRAFLTFSDKPRLSETLTEEIAQGVHRNYRDKDRGSKDPDDPALARWDRLLPSLQDSNIAQAEDVPNKLALVGKRPEEGGARLRLEPNEVDLLAEMEHGRWNHERLTRGWRFGHRHVSRLETPHLKPWKDLHDDTKRYDIEAVRNIDTLLEGVGWGVTEA